MSKVWWICVATRSSYLLTAPGASDLGVMAGLVKKHLTAVIYSVCSPRVRVRLVCVSLLLWHAARLYGGQRMDCSQAPTVTHHSLRTMGCLHFGFGQGFALSGMAHWSSNSNSTNGRPKRVEKDPDMSRLEAWLIDTRQAARTGQKIGVLSKSHSDSSK